MHPEETPEPKKRGLKKGQKLPEGRVYTASREGAGGARPGEFHGTRPDPVDRPPSQGQLKKYRAFAEEWCRSGSLRQASIAAGCRTSWGYSGVLYRPEVQRYISEYQAKRQEASEISAAEVYDTYRAIIRTTAADVFEPWASGGPKTMRAQDDLTPEALLAIKGVTFNPDGTVRKVELHDRLKALQDCARMQGLFARDNAQTADSFAKAIHALDEHMGLLPSDEDREAWRRGEE